MTKTELKDEIIVIGSQIYNLEQKKYYLEMVLEGAEQDLIYLPEEEND